jgi:CheY-like chemotaxis protein
MEEKEPNVEISITDSGPGIHPDDMERIFEPFCQGPEQVWREKGGSGLGLTISKQFVELHGGRIWLESRLGEGTTFFVSLPRSMPLSPEAPAVRWINREWNWVERKRRPAVPALPNRPRLVVFDPTQEILPGVGQFAGQVELVTANSVGETVAEVQKTPAHAILVGGHTPAVVLQTLQAARQALPDTPLVGWAMPARVAPALQAGANHYLVKPVSLETLKQKLDTIPGPLRRVLIADDDNDTRQLLSRMVQLYAPGVALVSAATGGEALDLARLQPFDLMLLDVMMPEQNGLEVLAHIRGDPGTRDLPVIAISAQDIHETQPACTEMLVMMGQEVQLAKALECAVGISEILLRPVAEPYPVQ